MLNRIKSLIAIKTPSMFEKIMLSVAIFATIALIISTN
jgi:hypothetical protein